MNCKQGDLAIVVRSVCGNEGKIVRCLKLYPAGTDGMDKSLGALWETDGTFKTVMYGTQIDAELTRFAADSRLRPLRGDLSNDEVDTETPIIKETEKC